MLYKPDLKPGEKERSFYVKVLRSNECQCERGKQPGMALCFKCYRSLPRDMQRDLYKKMCAGFEEAYDAACAFLND